MDTIERRPALIASHGRMLEGDLWIPRPPKGVAIFAHGPGSSRFSPRNRFMAECLNRAGFATLLLDLLNLEEEEEERWTRLLRLDIELLATRLISARVWVSIDDSIGGLPVGYVGSSTGAAAALVAAAREPGAVSAVVSRSGRPDFASDVLPDVRAPTLLIVAGNDPPFIEINQQALGRLRCEKALRVVPGATHLFEEPGALEQVARHASEWFQHTLCATGADTLSPP